MQPVILSNLRAAITCLQANELQRAAAYLQMVMDHLNGLEPSNGDDGEPLSRLVRNSCIGAITALSQEDLEAAAMLIAKAMILAGR